MRPESLRKPAPVFEIPAGPPPELLMTPWMSTSTAGVVASAMLKVRVMPVAAVVLRSMLPGMTSVAAAVVSFVVRPLATTVGLVNAMVRFEGNATLPSVNAEPAVAPRFSVAGPAVVESRPPVATVKLPMTALTPLRSSLPPLVRPPRCSTDNSSR